MSTIGPVARRPHTSRDVVSTPGSTNLADLLERVLDKGVVVAGDIVIALGSVELLTLKLRLLIASIDKARELGIDWWEHDAFLSSGARAPELEGDTGLLRKRLDRLERLLLPPPQETDQEHAAVEQQSTAAPAYVLDKQGRPIAELKLPWEQAQGDERSQAQERAPQPAAQPHQEPPHAPEPPPQPEAAQAEQPAGAGPLLGQALHERIAQAMRPGLGVLPQQNTQPLQPVEEAGPEEQQEEEHAPEQEQPHAQEPEATQNAVPARGPDTEGRLSAEPKRGRVKWRLAVVDLDREGRVIAERKQPVEQPQGAAQNAAPAYILDQQGRVIAELQQPVQQPQEDEGPQVQERAPQPAAQPHQEPPHAPEPPPQPEAAQAEQLAGAGPLLGLALHERIAQAVRPVLEELPQRIAQGGQPVEQARPVRLGAEEQQEEEPPHAPAPPPQPQAAPQNAAPTYVLDQTGRLIAELQQPEPAQPAGAGPLLDQALHERMARAVRSVLEELRQRNAQAPQPVEQARPVRRGAEEQQEEEPPHAPEPPPQPQAAQNAAPAYIFDEKGRLIAEVQLPLAQPQEDEGPQLQERAPQPGEQPHEEEPPHAPEPPPQPEAGQQAEQPAGTGPLLAQVLHERLAQAVRPVLEGLRQRNAQAPQPVE
jgi:Gas vesicle protein